MKRLGKLCIVIGLIVLFVGVTIYGIAYKHNKNLPHFTDKELALRDVTEKYYAYHSHKPYHTAEIRKANTTTPLAIIIAGGLCCLLGLAFVVRSNYGPTHKKICPYCCEKIKLAAKVCRYCGKELNTGDN